MFSDSLDIVDAASSPHAVLSPHTLSFHLCSMLEGDPLLPTAGAAKMRTPRHSHQQRAGDDAAGGMPRNLLSPMRTPEHSSWLQPKGM
jgi:hypothetical protein